MKIKIEEADIKKLKALKNKKIDYYLTKIDDIEEEKAIEFMEFLYDKANDYLKEKNYEDTPESLLLEKIADYIYDTTN